MKKNLFVFTVSVAAVLGVCSASRADVASTNFVETLLETKVSTDRGLDHKNEALVVDENGTVGTAKIDEIHLADYIKDKINNALTKIDADTEIDDKTISVSKLNVVDSDSTDKVLTVNNDGSVSAKFVSIPVGQDGIGGAAAIWIEQQ